MGETKKVLTELKNGVLIVTINREERRNAIDPETSAMMEQILNDAEQNPEVGAIIITGTGDRSFCSGEDLAAYDENGTCQTIMAHGFAGITERLSAKPIICAANGTAVAGGLEIALACDIIVASENARFGLSEVKVGFLATSGGLIRLPNIIPKKIASEMVLTGKLIDAQRAYEVGLVNYVVPREQVMDKAMELAEIIAANAPISLKLSKEISMQQHSALSKMHRDIAIAAGITSRKQKMQQKDQKRSQRNANRTGKADNNKCLAWNEKRNHVKYN